MTARKAIAWLWDLARCSYFCNTYREILEAKIGIPRLSRVLWWQLNLENQVGISGIILGCPNEGVCPK